MTTRPRLISSVPFWLLIAGSLASAVAGALLLVDKLAVMTTTLTDGTATGVEVYVGQVWGVLGAILVGAGVIGLALALTLGVLRSFVPAAAVEVVEPIDWTSEDETGAAEPEVVVTRTADEIEPAAESTADASEQPASAR